MNYPLNENQKKFQEIDLNIAQIDSDIEQIDSNISENAANISVLQNDRYPVTTHTDGTEEPIDVTLNGVHIWTTEINDVTNIILDFEDDGYAHDVTFMIPFGDSPNLAFQAKLGTTIYYPDYYALEANRLNEINVLFVNGVYYIRNNSYANN